MLLPSENGCSEGLKNIFSAMNPDDITFIASRDALIISFGEKLYQKHGHKQHKHQYIKQKLRELSRFLLVARNECDQITDLESCINPTRFSVMITSVKKLCGYESFGNSFQTPSLALKIGQNLKACADILRNKALMSDDECLEKKAINFHTLCDSDWSSSVSAAAYATLEMQRQNKPHVLPLTEDVTLVTLYLREQRQSCLNAVKSNPNVDTWHALAKVCLANIILFNRRRSGEAARILVKDYREGNTRSVAEDDVLLSLSKLEKHLVQNFVRIEVDGKRGRKVPILLTSEMCREIDELLKTRDKAGIVEENPYIFSRPFYSSETHMAGHKCLRDAAIKSKAKEPSAMTSTKLRKHIATVSQILNLSTHELDQVCGFMGHSVGVHREFYRLPEDTLQLAKVSRLLLAMEQGNVARFKGMPLEDVDVDMEVDESDIEGAADDENEAKESGGENFQEETESIQEQTESIQGGQEQQKMTLTRKKRKQSGKQLESDDSDQEKQKKRPTRSTRKKSMLLPADETESDQGQLESGESDQEWSPRKKEKTSSARHVVHPLEKRKEPAAHRDFLTDDQLKVVWKYFKEQIDSQNVPKKQQCEFFLKKEPLLAGRSWEKIKYTVRNEIERRKRVIKKAAKQS